MYGAWMLLLLAGCALVPKDEMLERADGDGDGVLFPEDCAPSDPNVFPGADELCDEADNNCNGAVDEEPVDAPAWYLDADGDGFGDEDREYLEASCAQPAGYADNGADCDDLDVQISPAAVELCDEVDNDCDGSLDEVLEGTPGWFRDADGDGYGNVEDEYSLPSCTAPDGYVDNSTDCDDLTATTYPEATEICDEVDNDCDDVVDDEPVDATDWYLDADEDGFGDEASPFPIATCQAPEGYLPDNSDCDDLDAAINPDAEEICDELDNDCDGTIDQMPVTASAWYRDADDDSHGDGLSPYPVPSCTAPEGYVSDALDCDDTESAVHPSADELCNGVDDDCDGEIDVAPVDAPTWYLDADDDGFGAGEYAYDGAECSAPSGYVAEASDCDDAVAEINPDAEELTADGVDQDCDGGELCYSDADGDNRRTSDIIVSLDDDCADETEASSAVPDGDCDDIDASVSPDATETPYNGVDDDCDEDSRDDDLDEDGFDATATGGDDCDDTNEDVFPDAAEVCDDGVVNDCESDETAAAAACGLSGTLDLADADIKVTGRDPNTPTCLAFAGDMDGDGLDELLISTSLGDTGGSDSGTTYILMGDGIIGEGFATFGIGSAEIRLTGETYYDEAGTSVAGAGDVDGDGLDDILIGAPLHEGTDSSSGTAYLLLGAGEIGSASGIQDLGIADLQLDGSARYEQAGSDVSMAGDVDGDGLGDLHIGANQMKDGSAWVGGSYLLLSGGSLSGPETSIDLSDSDLVLRGEGSFDYAGSAIARAGDVDGDGLDDQIVGAYGEDTEGSSSGAAYVLLSGGSLLSGTTELSLAEADIKLIGEVLGAEAGRAVSFAGDVDGDGCSDILIAAHHNSYPSSGVGAVYLLLGGGTLAAPTGVASLSEADISIRGESRSDYAGESISGSGDVDGDDLDDVVIGAIYEDSGGDFAGAAYLLFGGGALQGASGNLSLSKADLKLLGEDANDEAGSTVAMGGDLNGDGLADFIVGAMGDDTDGTDEGAAYLFFGGGY